MKPEPAVSALPVARIKRFPEDWVVRELLPSSLVGEIEQGEGEHIYLHIEKRGMNTEDVAHRLMAFFSVPHVAVGYAGRKDKHAQTRQWFSVHSDERTLDVGSLERQGVTVIAAGRAPRKLRRGAHERNEFDIRLREVESTDATCWERLARPFPNYFGPQRFGSTNLEEAIDWVLHRRERMIPRARAGWFLSVLRSHLFNTIIDARLEVAQLDAVIDGDVLQAGVATVPLWGRGRSLTQGRALEIERRALADLADVCHALEFAGVSQQRRSAWVTPCDLRVEADAPTSCALVRFGLPPSAYATVMLANTFRVLDESQ